MDPRYCTHCGQPEEAGAHETCRLTVLDPPRYCVQCGRRMVVKVTPDRWTAGWQVLGLSADVAPDIAAVAARILARCRPPDVTTLPEEIKLFAPVLKDAGLL